MPLKKKKSITPHFKKRNKPSKPIQKVKKNSAYFSSAQLLQNVISHIPYHIFWKDSHLAYQGCNQNFAKAAGLHHADEIAGKRDRDLVWKKEEAESYQKTDFEILTSGQPKLQYEESQLQADGKQAILLTSRVPLFDDNRKVVGVLGISADITENKKFEEHIRQTQKMDAIRRIAGGVAHDFNNLLTVIAGYAELRLELLPKDDDMRNDMEQILKAAERARLLANQLLSFTRQQVQQPIAINLNQLIVKNTSMLRRAIPENIELVILQSEDLGQIQMDPGLMEQALVNLVINARDSMPEGGKIILQTRNTTLDEDFSKRHAGIKPGDYVMLSVSDNGCGMTLEVKQHLFEPFFTTKPKGKGAGLGLATSHGIVLKTGGFIEVLSEEGKGSLFKIYLPRVSSPVTEALVKSEILTSGLTGSERILLVEDEPMVRAFTKSVLKERGYEILEAATGDEALRTLHREGQKIELIISDLIMPQMGGHELAGEIRKINPGIKILFTSGYTDDNVIKERIFDHRESFIRKPYTPMEISRKVREILDLK